MHYLHLIVLALVVTAGAAPAPEKRGTLCERFCFVIFLLIHPPFTISQYGRVRAG
jgi:hypothetical protein